MISDRICDDILPELKILNTVIPVRAVVSYLGDNCIQNLQLGIYHRKFSFTAMLERSLKT